MISKDELEKFTVLQLKEKLKSRKLATSGAKPDLIARLYENMVAEESLLSVTGNENDSAGTTEFDLSNVDVDEVLGMSEERIGDSEKEVLKNESSNEKVGDSEKEIPKNENQDAIPEMKTSGLSTADGQKLLLISKKLGLPCKSNGGDGDTEDRLTKRTHRFGPITQEVRKKQTRAERFGLVSDKLEDGKKKRRIDRFGSGNSEKNLPAQEEKLRKRAERFGAAAK